MIEIPNGVTESEVLSQIQNEYNSSLQTTTRKREIFQRNDKLYLNTEDQDKKLLSKQIFSTIQTLISLHYMDESIVEFAGRQLGDETYAQNLNKLAKFDYEEMKLAKKRRLLYEDKFKYGVGIEAIVGWDKTLNIPITVVIDPQTWLPDNEPDQNYGPRFHLCEYIATQEQLTKEDGYDEQAVKEYVSEVEQGLVKKAQKNGEDIRKINSIGRNDTIQVIHAYTILKGEKYHVTVSQTFSKILRCYKIKAKTKAQEKNPSLISFPVIVRNWIPYRYDAYGINIFDILADKQMRTQLIDNLMIIRAEYEALGGTFLVDPELVPDLSQLKTPTTGPKYISGKAGGISVIPKGEPASDVWNVRDRIQNSAMLEIGIDERSMGITSGANITATENQRVQANANLKIMLGLKEDIIAEKEFRKQWYWMYKVYFKSSDKKLLMISNDLGANYFEIKKSQINTDNDIDVIIKLKSEIKAEQEQKKVGFMALYGNIIQDQTLPTASLNYVKRKALLLNGLSPDEVKRIVPNSKEEEEAIGQLELLNRNEEVGPVRNISEDHLTYIMIYDQASDTEAKYKAIEARKKAYVLSGQSQEQPQPQGEGMGNMGNMLMNQMMQKQPQQAESLSPMQ